MASGNRSPAKRFWKQPAKCSCVGLSTVPVFENLLAPRLPVLVFYDYPREQWRHLRPTNPVESPFAALPLRTDAAKRYKGVDRTIAVTWKMLMVAEKRFRRLQAPELLRRNYRR